MKRTKTNVLSLFLTLLLFTTASPISTIFAEESEFEEVNDEKVEEVEESNEINEAEEILGEEDTLYIEESIEERESYNESIQIENNTNETESEKIDELETITTRSGEEIAIDRLPEDIQKQLYFPEEGEEIHDPFLFEEITREGVSTSSTWTWPNNPNWPDHVRKFLNENAMRAQRVADANGLYASVILAQAIQETGWGRSTLATQYNNFFGIKATGHTGSTVNMPTWEWIPDPTHPDGGFEVTIRGEFRAYSSPEESFRDYANFLRNNPTRYRGAFIEHAPSPQHAIRNIHRGVHVGTGGYATDPEYADKVIRNIATYDLERLDSAPTVRYRTHVQSRGDLPWVYNGSLGGTSGQRLRMESLQIQLENIPNSGVEYQTHVESYGWMSWKRNGERAGTYGEAKRVEAVRIRLTGEAAQNYDIYYRVHSEQFGWLDWARNGEPAGTEGYRYRLEAVEIQLLPKGHAAPGNRARPFRSAPTFVAYTTHVESQGWQDTVREGATSGTVGQGKRLEGIRLHLQNQEYGGTIRYRTHVQSYGWQSWRNAHETAGTTGERKRLEAIEIQLTGETARQFDVYYRVHVEGHGWLGWARNGQSAGTEGRGLRMEAIEVRLVRRGGPAPGTTSRHFIR